MLEAQLLLEKVGSMPLKCSIWSNFIFLLVLATATPANRAGQDDKICTIHSSKEVLMGSSFQIYCVFKNECNKIIYRDNVPLPYNSSNLTAVMNIVKLTQATTFTCRCKDRPEPCGMDITPGYPPQAPQNLSCVQEGELGKVNCTWKTGLETHIQTTSHLWVQGDPPVNYTSKTASTLFAVPSTQTKLTVRATAINSLGSATSAALTFMLNDIVKPLKPNIVKVKCNSRDCQLYTDKRQNIHLVDIRYKTDQESWNSASFNHANSSTYWNITSLTPYSLYTFQVRWKLGPSRGLWSEWSEAKEMTDEEAPAVMVDAWYFGDSKNTHLLWKELSKSEASGKILGYNVTELDERKKISSTFIKHPCRNYSVRCSICTVSIFAKNSKGHSPTRRIQLQPIGSLRYTVSHQILNDSSIALSWQRPNNAPEEYLVEWYPVERKEQLQWIRVERHLHTTNITGLQPAKCYDVAVVYLFSSGTRKVVFSGLSTQQSVPQQGPECDATVKNYSVEVKWEDIPLERRGGCLTNYTIYLRDSGDKIKRYSIGKPSEKKFTISDLSPGQQYKLWVTAWTKAGEGPKGRERNIATPPEMMSAEKPMALVVSVGGVVFLACLFFLCICHFSSVHRRFSRCCHCLMPSIVPDPANSKWAKECASEKGEMKLQLYLSDSSMSEEEPDTVEVQELPQEKFKQENIPKDGTYHSVSNLSVQEQELEQEQEQKHHIPSSLYQATTTSSYLKSLSHESGSSDTTQASRGTDMTVDYISSHGVLSGDEDEEVDDENFFPCPTSPFLSPLMSIGGKLTLDTVKIDCSDFLDFT
ncbi:interleukin-12 receptor subunit beta-2 [Astyanax mexicanus]|uniref:interleukin-12 receptor subunit beta-2 n=1 Tax=Astyanax mexicanus TaxID=7994 RepID=UPI0020CB26AC|nr:interleukin-12 receptor subunit beta-2 [Astyanax mexicanus]